MTKIATMGTSSCATIAIQGFENKDGYSHYKEEIAYQEAVNSGKKWTKIPKKDADWFYNQILFPTMQELGRTDDMPFSLCMKQIDKGPLSSKYIVCTLNAANFNFENYFWPKLLKQHGFSLVSTTKNHIGSMNYIFVRNPSFNDEALEKALSIVENL